MVHCMKVDCCLMSCQPLWTDEASTHHRNHCIFAKSTTLLMVSNLTQLQSNHYINLFVLYFGVNPLKEAPTYIQNNGHQRVASIHIIYMSRSVFHSIAAFGRCLNLLHPISLIRSSCLGPLTCPACPVSPPV